MLGCRRLMPGSSPRAPGPDSLMVRPDARSHRAPDPATNPPDSPHERGMSGEQVSAPAGQGMVRHLAAVLASRLGGKMAHGMAGVSAGRQAATARNRPPDDGELKDPVQPGTATRSQRVVSWREDGGLRVIELPTHSVLGPLREGPASPPRAGEPGLDDQAGLQHPLAESVQPAAKNPSISSLRPKSKPVRARSRCTVSRSPAN